ncbi:MAG: carboxymuconolactone decarboxylase family protein [Planctomycetota bacterium]
MGRANRPTSRQRRTATTREAKMDRRTGELIAIGAAVTANCVARLRFHLRKAREEGAETAEIQAAIRVGQMVRKGAADSWDEVATTLAGMDSFNGFND